MIYGLFKMKNMLRLYTNHTEALQRGHKIYDFTKYIGRKRNKSVYYSIA